MQPIRFVLALLLVTTACTQAPAPAAYKGSDYYGRNATRASSGSPNDLQIEPRYYDRNSPRLKVEHSEQAVPATAGSVGVSDLPPPVSSTELPRASSKSESAPKTLPFPSQGEPRVDAGTRKYNLTQNLATQKPVAYERAVETRTEPVINEEVAIISDPAPATGKRVPSTTTKMIWPVEGKVISKFGAQAQGRGNDGINIEATEGEPIYAAQPGTVTYVGNELKGYGNMALVQHSGGLVTSYAHANDIVVKKGDKVEQGQVIGYVGRTGGVSSAQLHFSVREGKTPVDPARYLGSNVAQN